jgi:hypothetical protein
MYSVRAWRYFSIIPPWLGAFGRFSLYIKIVKNIVSYWHRIESSEKIPYYGTH